MFLGTVASLTFPVFPFKNSQLSCKSASSPRGFVEGKMISGIGVAVQGRAHLKHRLRVYDRNIYDVFMNSDRRTRFILFAQ